MTWTHIKSNGGMGLEEQWIFRPENKPLVSLKQGDDPQTWVASLLNLTCISACSLVCHNSTLEQAESECEQSLHDMGWRWGAKSGSDSSERRT